jgi:hypothetical protein
MGLVSTTEFSAYDSTFANRWSAGDLTGCKKEV